jgi:hypothetical protein
MPVRPTVILTNQPYEQVRAHARVDPHVAEGAPNRVRGAEVVASNRTPDCALVDDRDVANTSTLSSRRIDRIRAM